MDGVQESNRLALCRVRIKSLPVKMADGQPSTVGGGKLYRLKRSATGALVQEEGATPLSVGDETTLGSCTAQDGSPLTAWTVPTLAECERDGLGLWYVSSSNYPAAEGQEVLLARRLEAPLVPLPPPPPVEALLVTPCTPLLPLARPCHPLPTPCHPLANPRTPHPLYTPYPPPHPPSPTAPLDTRRGPVHLLYPRCRR